jgi:hypothetical protein
MAMTTGAAMAPVSFPRNPGAPVERAPHIRWLSRNA